MADKVKQWRVLYGNGESKEFDDLGKAKAFLRKQGQGSIQQRYGSYSWENAFNRYYKEGHRIRSIG